jgi:hypothetical protein
MRYYLLDGAKCNNALDDTLNCAPKYLSLYKGRSEENLSSVAPYLLEINDVIEKWIFEHGWGEFWGYFIECDLPFEALYNHFRKFLIVETEDFKPLYFRFYDPRVILIFLPTCSPEQLEELFGPVDRFICEDEDADFALVFSLSKGKLITERTKWNILFPNWAANENQASLTGHLPPNSVEKSPIQSAPEEKKSGRRFIY